MRIILRPLTFGVLLGGLIPQTAFSQSSTLLDQFTIEGRLYSAGNPMTGAVKVKLEVIDAGNMSCVLYRETQDLNLTSTSGADGLFAIPLGAGSNVLSGANALSRVFANGVSQKGDLDGDNVVDAGASPGGCEFIPADSSYRFVRLNVSTDGGSSYVTLSPDTKVTAAPTAMVANSLQGINKDGFIRVNSGAGMSLTQSSAETVFSTTNLQRLTQLLAPTSSVSFGSQRLTDIATPTASTDATNKGYVDSNIGGHAIDATTLAAPSNGQVLTWSAGKWVAQAVSTSDSTKLPLAGGTMSGPIDMGNNPITNLTNLSMSGHLLMASNRIMKLPNVTDSTENTIGVGASYPGALVYNSTSKTLKVHDGTTYITQAYLDGAGRLPASVMPTTAVGVGTTAGGDLDGTYPNPTVRNGVIDANKLNVTGTQAINRIIVTDATDPSKLTYKYCSENEILKFSTITGWGCAAMGITALTGDVAASASGSANATIQAGVVNSTKLANSAVTTAKLNDYAVTEQKISDGAVTDIKINSVNVDKIASEAGSYFHYKPNGIACGDGELLKWNDGAEQWECIDGGSLTAINAVKLQGTSISSTAPSSTGQVLTYTGSMWAPSTHYLKATGSESAPQLSFSGSTYGMYYGSGIVGITAAGKARIVANSGGYVGVGTTVPLSHLHVHSTESTGTMINITNSTFTSRSYSLRLPGSADTNPGEFIIYENNTNRERLRISAAGDIGIGESLPRAKLDVGGSIISAPATANASATVDFAKGNIQSTDNTVSCTAIRLDNLKDGGSYMLIVKNSTSATCAFTAYSDAGTSALTIHMPPNHGATITGKHTVYNIAVSGGDVYLSWTPGY